MHYSWSTEERARRALKNVSTLLQPGGYLIGTMPDADVIVRKLRSGMCLGPLSQLFFVHLFYYDGGFLFGEDPPFSPWLWHPILII